MSLTENAELLNANADDIASGCTTLRILILGGTQFFGKRLEKAVIKPRTADADMSPYGLPASWMMDTSRAMNAGFRFSDLMNWLPPLLHEAAAET